ncbi:MAG: DEAD/DEAH box helicase family protein [Methylobacter sp.]|uniref:DEAD/DEAH box helicase n=1 Tax=Methylobacter sp. TaxID=2051955 RepID=UPI0025D2E114|nr:DEAD/DEAH box helicase family protein [Methylobacter sp.]MCK9622179.1 DEAD/DEAH box helicase family protein [Methylobacter sp.]
MQLRDYQTKLISDIRQAIREGHTRIICQLHVGGGKTIIAGEISRSAREKMKRSLFIAPRRQLVYQAADKFNGLGVSTGIIMAGEKQFSQPLVQVGSIDTLTSRIKSGKMRHPDAAIVMADEAHAVFSPERLEFLKNYPLVLGITATPALANGKGMGAFYTKIVEGPTMAEMVEAGYLVPMRYYGADAPDLEAVKLNADGDYQESALAEASDKPELIGSVYRNYKRLASDRTTLIFAVNCKHGRHIYEEFLSHGEAVEYIDAHTSTEERDAMEKRVADGVTRVIVNIGVMAFGTDWPRISCVIVARVTRNIAAWIQMVGRGSRLHPAKQDCIVIYHGHNFEELGPIDAPIEWSLDDKTTIRERKERAQQDAKEPKEIKCKKCGYIFKSSRVCPSCHTEMIAPGEAIPFHEAELVELKVSAADKIQWYAEFLGYCKQNGKGTNFALAMFKAKFNSWPYKKNSIQPATPSQEVLNYITSRRIAYARGRGA